MKKICLLLALPLLLQSCLKHQEDLFPENASERIVQALANADEVLKGAPNGWIMDYYPGPTTGTLRQEWGGFTLLLKFEDNDQVVMRSLYGTARKDSTATSLYQLIAETGPLLSFNTFNPLIHYFSHPRNPDGIGSGNGNLGMGGDHEFIILSATPEKVVLKGKKHGNTIIMTPFPGGTTWGDYLDDIRTVENDMLWMTSIYTYTNGSDTLRVTRGASPNRRRLEFSYDSVVSPIQTMRVVVATMSFVSDPDGIAFYSPITLLGQTISRLDYDRANDVFTAPGQSGKMYPTYLPLNQQLTTGTWYFNIDDMGSTSQAVWDGLRTHASAFLYRFIFLGNGFTGYFYDYGIYLGFNVAGNATNYNANLRHDVEVLSPTRIRIETVDPVPQLPNANNNAVQVRGGNAVLEIFGGYGTVEGSKIYDLTADDPRGATWIKLQDINDPDNWYMLVQREMRPFND